MMGGGGPGEQNCLLRMLAFMRVLLGAYEDIFLVLGLRTVHTPYGVHQTVWELVPLKGLK